MKILLLLAILTISSWADLYNIQVLTASKSDAQTDGDIYITLVGKKADSEAFELDRAWYNDFERNALDSYSINVETNIGTLKCIRFSTASYDAWLPSYAIVTPEDGDRDYYFYNTEGTWLSAQASDGGVSSLEMCEQGTETYYITTRTASDWNSGSDNIYVRMKIEGKKGDTETGYLNNRNYDDFTKGAEDTFVVPGMKLVGKVKCVEITVEGSDAWKFDYIEVYCDNYRSPFYLDNAEGAWMSADASEGENILEIC